MIKMWWKPLTNVTEITNTFVYKYWDVSSDYFVICRNLIIGVTNYFLIHF